MPRLDISNIVKFMLLLGPISSIFNSVTYFVMIYPLVAWSNPAPFQTGGFVRIAFDPNADHPLIRTAEVPFLESLASPALIATSVVICMVSIALPFTIVDGSLGFVPLPPVHWTVVLAIIGCYAILTQKVDVMTRLVWSDRCAG